MDFRQLNYFVTVAQELSFSRAAERLHISQPPLSQQIKQLEDDLGVMLFERTRRVVRLTHAGELFYNQALDILKRYAAARELCAWSVDGRAGRLKLAFTASVPMFDGFPRILQEFRKLYPRIQIDLRHMSTGEQLAALNSQEIDVGFLRPSISFRPPACIETRQLWVDELVLALSKDHPLANDNALVNLSALANADFILFPQALGCGLFEHITALTASAGFAPRIVQEVRENSTTLALVAAGFGVSIIPGIYAASTPPGVVYRQLDHPQTHSRIVMASYQGHKNPSLALFLDYVAANVPGRGI